MTAGQLVFSIEANGDSIEEAAEDWDLNVEAVAEAVEYVARNRDLVEAEFAEERRRVEPFLTIVRLLLDDKTSRSPRDRPGRTSQEHSSAVMMVRLARL
jgi:hypothetical protein